MDTESAPEAQESDPWHNGQGDPWSSGSDPWGGAGGAYPRSSAAPSSQPAYHTNEAPVYEESGNGTDSETESSLWEADPAGLAEGPHEPEEVTAQRLFFAYQKAKANWRRLSQKTCKEG